MLFVIGNGNHFVHSYTNSIQGFGDETGVGVDNLTYKNFVAYGYNGCFHIKVAELLSY